MSDALEYLLKARPEAMQKYFGFLKASGKHLDPKTRAIISVITKVDNQTEAGFRQYLKRALKKGVTANEILDAMLTAFPTLGLTKIIWAVDLLIDMNLPEFQIENLDGEADWHEVAVVSELPQGKVTVLKVKDCEYYIFNDKDEFRVYDNICPHQATMLTEDDLSGNYLVCPKHKWKFNLETGECIENGDRLLNRLQHKVDNNTLYIQY